MASIFSKILGMFSGGESSGGAPAEREPQEYKDCRIYAAPMKEGAQYRLAGRIEKDVDGAVLTRTFIRADVYSVEDDAIEGTFSKARQIIDQNGPSLFADGVATRNA